MTQRFYAECLIYNQSAKMIDYLSNTKFQFHTVFTDYLTPFKIKITKIQKIVD